MGGGVIGRKWGLVGSWWIVGEGVRGIEEGRGGMWW